MGTLSRRRGSALLVTALAAAAAIAVAVALTFGSAGLPRVPAALNTPTGSLLVRPSRLTYTADASGLLSGPSVTTLNSTLHWSSWTARRGLGTGDNLLSHCQASGCTAGEIHRYPVRLEVWRPESLHGQRVFTRLTIWYTARRPAGAPAHYTFSDLYDDGVWSFGPPAATGYCTHTYGAPRAAGCAAVTTLPPN